MQQSVQQNKFLFNLFNRLLHICHYSVGTYDQNFDFKIRRDDSVHDNMQQRVKNFKIKTMIMKSLMEEEIPSGSK